MNWDEVLLIILAVFGCATLLLTQITEVLLKIPEIIRAWQNVQHALREPRESPPGPHAPPGVDEGTSSAVARNSPENRRLP